MLRSELPNNKYDVMYIYCGSGWYPEGTLLQLIGDDGVTSPLFIDEGGEEMYVGLANISLSVPLTAYLGGE